MDALVSSMALVSVLGAGQETPRIVESSRFAPAALDRRTADWKDAARAHVSGQFDEPASLVARWPPDMTRVVVDRVIRRAREGLIGVDGGRRGAYTEEDRRVLATGLLLHTDIAIVDQPSGSGGTTGAGAWAILDAKPLAPIRYSIHWSLAHVLASALAKDSGGAPIARAWFRAVGALYQQNADLGQLRAHLLAGAELVPEDPVLLLYEGALHQAFADPRVQSYITRLRRPEQGKPNRFPVSYAIEDADRELGIAERTLRRALAIDPSLVEARIRLAHVEGARGKPAEAIALARQTLESPLPGFLEYYGAMVLGRAEARLGHYGEARAAFGRAVARYPGSQAARVALSHVGLAEGRSADAVAALVQALGPDASEKFEDPWRAYFLRHEPDAQSRLDDFRRSVR